MPVNDPAGAAKWAADRYQTTADQLLHVLEDLVVDVRRTLAPHTTDERPHTTAAANALARINNALPNLPWSVLFSYAADADHFRRLTNPGDST